MDNKGSSNKNPKTPKEGKASKKARPTKKVDKEGTVHDTLDKDEKIEKTVEKEAEDYKKKLTTTSKGAFTPTTMQKKRTVPLKKTWKPLAAGGILIGMALIGIVTSSNLVLTASNNPLYSPETGSLKGFTMNEDGERLVGAFVAVKGKDMDQLTNENGKFKFKNVPKGELVLIATYPGYQTVEFPTMVLGGTEIQGIGDTNLTLPRITGSVIDETTGDGPVGGKVYDNNRNPEVNVSVTDNATGRNTTTNGNGSFDLGLLPFGERELTIVKANYRTLTVNMYNSPSRPTLDILLTPGTGQETLDLTDDMTSIIIDLDIQGPTSSGHLIEYNGTAMAATVGNNTLSVVPGQVTISATAVGGSTTTKTFYVDEDGGYMAIEVERGTTKVLEGDREDLQANLTICGGVIIIMSIFILFTGVTAIKRRRFWVAVTGSLFGSVFMLVTFQYGIILGLLAFGLLLFSRREFE